jgi:hypothetical protein
MIHFNETIPRPLINRLEDISALDNGHVTHYIYAVEKTEQQLAGESEAVQTLSHCSKG